MKGIDTLLADLSRTFEMCITAGIVGMCLGMCYAAFNNDEIDWGFWLSSINLRHLQMLGSSICQTTSASDLK